MARPISWLPRLHSIRKAVAGSIRSHYTRQDLERLFELQPRAAGKLLEILPTVTIGSAALVEREALEVFLDRIHAADDTSAVVREAREAKAPVRKAIRSLVRRDVAPVAIEGAPESVGLARGRLEVSFRTVEELADAMYWVARVIEEDGERFARAFEVEMPEAVVEPDEVREMFAELERDERAI